MGMYTHTLDPTNEYILASQAGGWKLLQEIWSHKNVEQLWVEAEDDYLKRSEK